MVCWIAIIGRQHLFPVGVPYASGREVREDVFSTQRRQRLAGVDVAAADAVASGGDVPVLNDRVGRHDNFVGDLVADLHGDFVHGGQRSNHVVGLQQLITLALRIAIVRAFADDADHFPRAQADHSGNEMLASGIARIRGPAQPVRVAEAVGPDFFLDPGFRHERVVVRDAVTAVFAESARGRVFGWIRNDAEDLADERVEALRIRPRDRAHLSGAAVADADVHDAPLGIAAPRGGMEHHLTHRMDPVVQLQAQHFARRAFEGERSEGWCRSIRPDTDS